ncbi:MAG: hypothetical protein F6K24_32515 [Okeania sp. SIO2D1]|nr:hypothetical protein [Okeania sp. SIO2D1]
MNYTNFIKYCYSLNTGNSSGRQQRCDPATTPARLRNAHSCEVTGNSGATPRRRQLACGMRTPVRQQATGKEKLDKKGGKMLNFEI